MRRTSLSKAWSLIDRFSEDIDLTIDRECLGFAGDRAPEAATSRSEQQRRLQQLKQSCSVVIAEQIAPALMAHLDRLLAATEFPALFDSPTCTVRALLPERTF